MKVTVDMALCQDHGQCAIAAPAVFSINDDGKLEYDGEPGGVRALRRRGGRRRLPGPGHRRRGLMGDAAGRVVGGSLAGLRAAEQLRLAGHTGPVTVYSAPSRTCRTTARRCRRRCWPTRAETDAEAMVARLAFRRRAVVDDVDFRLGAEVVAVPTWPPGRCTGCADGTRGALRRAGRGHRATPRRLGVPGPTAGRHVLRTVEDCLAPARRAGAGQPRRRGRGRVHRLRDRLHARRAGPRTSRWSSRPVRR